MALSELKRGVPRPGAESRVLVRGDRSVLCERIAVNIGGEVYEPGEKLSNIETGQAAGFFGIEPHGSKAPHIIVGEGGEFVVFTKKEFLKRYAKVKIE